MSTLDMIPGNEVAHPSCCQIHDLIYGAAGSYYTNRQLGFLQDRCGQRMKELNVPGLEQYHELHTRSASRASELHLLLNEITARESCCSPFITTSNSSIFPASWRTSAAQEVNHA
jgi:hypothetical protein